MKIINTKLLKSIRRCNKDIKYLQELGLTTEEIFEALIGDPNNIVNIKPKKKVKQ